MSRRRQGPGQGGRRSRAPHRREAGKRSGTRGLAVAAVLGLALGAGLFLLTRGEEAAKATETADVAPAPPSMRHIHVKAEPMEEEESAPAPRKREPLPPSTGPDDPPQVDRASLPRVLPAPAYKPRPPGEWDGMLVDTSIQPYCNGEASCGLGRACVDNRCVACAGDADCARGESCVLDHCVDRAKVACRTRLDCRGGELCMLSGYSDDARGNRDMEATCQEPRGGQEPDLALVFDPDEIAEGQLPVPPAVDVEVMREEIAEAELPQSEIPESFFERPEEPLPAEPEEMPDELFPDAPSDLLHDMGELPPDVEDQPDEPVLPEAETDPGQQPLQTDPSQPLQPAPAA